MNDTLIILCLLGDPTLPATSIKHTGGFQIDIQELLSQIKNSHCDIHVITNTSQHRKKKLEKIDSYTIHRIPFDNIWLDDQNLLMQNYDKIKKSFFQIVEDISGENILIHSFYWLSGSLAYDAYNTFSINYVHSIVSLSIGKTLSGSKAYYNEQFELENKFLHYAKMIFSITDIEKEQLKKYYFVSDSLIIVVGRCVHYSFEHPCHRSDGYPENVEMGMPIQLVNYKWWKLGAFTYVGRIQKIKGLHYIIAAWIELYEKYKELTPPLWICGGVPSDIEIFRTELKQLISLKKLQKAENEQKIVWWGYLDFAGISTIYLKTAVLITHSQYEPGGRVLLEAMASSIPVIATPNGFAKDLIIDNYNGFLVDFGEISCLSQRMELFIHNKDISKQLGENAKKTYENQKEKWQCYQTQFNIYAECGLLSFKE